MELGAVLGILALFLALATLTIHFLLPPPAPKFATNIIYGRETVGSHEDDTATYKSVTVKFPTNQFSKIPSSVLCTPLSDPKNSDNDDAFQVTLTNIQTTGFTALVTRVGKPTWTQNMVLNWMALE